MPRIYAIAAVTLDGRIAYAEDHSSLWTSPEDKNFLRRMLDESAVIVVGRRTYDIARDPLSKRNCIVLTRSVPATERKSENLILMNPAGAPLEEFLQPYPTVAVLGGTQVFTYCLERNLLSELHLTIEPIVFGIGLPLFATEKAMATPFELLDTRRLNAGGTLLLHYRIRPMPDQQ